MKLFTLFAIILSLLLLSQANPLTIKQVRKIVLDFEAKLTVAFNTGDNSAIAALSTPDAVFSPNSPPTPGTEYGNYKILAFNKKTISYALVLRFVTTTPRTVTTANLVRTLTKTNGKFLLSFQLTSGFNFDAPTFNFFPSGFIDCKSKGGHQKNPIPKSYKRGFKHSRKVVKSFEATLTAVLQGNNPVGLLGLFSPKALIYAPGIGQIDINSNQMIAFNPNGVVISRGGFQILSFNKRAIVYSSFFIVNGAIKGQYVATLRKLHGKYVVVHLIINTLQNVPQFVESQFLFQLLSDTKEFSYVYNNDYYNKRKEIGSAPAKVILKN